MQALSIPNLATPPAAPPAAGQSPAAGKSADTGTVPSFAQAVQQAIVRNTPANDSQPAHASPSRGASSSTTSDPPAKVSANSRSNLGAQSGNLAALSTLPWINPAAVLQPVAVAVGSDSQKSVPASDTTGQQIALPAGQIQDSLAQDPQGQALASQTPALLALASTGTADQTSGGQSGTAQTPELPAPAAASTAPQTLASPTSVDATATQLQPSLPASAAVSFVESSPVMPSGLPDQAAASFDQKSVPAEHQPATVTNQPNDPSNPANMITGLRIQSVAAPSPSGIPVSAILPAIAQLQVPPQTSAPASANSTAGATPSAVRHSAADATIAPLPLFAPGFTGLTLPLLGSATHQLLPVPAQAATPAASPQADHGKSQDGLSNRDGKGSADSSTSSGPVLSHDVTAFQQVLSAQASAKPEVAAAPSVPALAALSTPPSNEHGASPAAAPAQEASTSLPQPAFHSFDQAASRFVNDAQLVQNATHSEMRIAMQSDKLGAVELHARVAGDEVGASILVEKRDAHAALAIELPALQQALSEKQLRVDQVTLIHGPLHASTGDAGAQSQAQHGDRGGQRPGTSPSLPGGYNNFYAASLQVSEPRGIFDSQGRLSVRA